MFIINGITTHTERLFADSKSIKTCSFCGHTRTFSEKSSNNKCDFCGHANKKRSSNFSKKSSKKGCKFCGHGFRSNEYSRKEDRYGSHYSDNGNYDEEKASSKSKDRYSDNDTEEKGIEQKYTLDLSGVFFHHENEENSTSVDENGYEEGQFSLSFGKKGDDSVNYDEQRSHIRSLDEWEDDSDSSYDRESENYDEENTNEESEYDESLNENLENEESVAPTEEQMTVLPQQITNIGTAQLPTMPQLSTTSLPTVSAGTETTLSPTLPGVTQYPVLPETQQYPINKQDQIVTTDPNTSLTQYPYGQSNSGNTNINLQQNLLLQAGQDSINGVSTNSYGQMSDGSMTPQWGNSGMSQQAYASVVNETIEYLRNLGILDENRVSKMSAGMVDGECIICMRPKFVFQIRGQGMRGVCEDCLRSRNSYGSAFSAGGIKGVLERGVMSLFGDGDDNRNSNSGYGIRSFGSGGGYGDSGGSYGSYGYGSGRYGDSYGGSEGAYGNNGIMGNGTPSQGRMNSLMSIAGKLTGGAGGGLKGMLGAVGNMLSGVAGTAGAGSQQLVMNALGQLVPIGSDPSAPYGYVKDPATGQMRPATSPEEGLAAGAAAGATTAPGVTNGATGTAGAATGVGAGGVAGTSGASSQQMVMNAQGQLVPIGSDPSAPYGYVKDPATGQMRPATSPEEGLAAGAAAAAAGATTAPGVANGATGTAGATTGVGAGGVAGTSGASSQQMVMNAQGQLVPIGSDPSAPYGYVKDPATGQMRPATSPEEGLAAGAAAAAAGATTATGVANGATGTAGAANTAGAGGVAGTAGASSQQMVMNAQGQLVPMGSDLSAPYGYVKDPATGQMRPATSPEEGLAAGAAAAAAGATTAPGVTNGVTGTAGAANTAGTSGVAGAVAAATDTATSAVSTAANAATGAVEKATNAAVGVANTAVNAANSAAATAANTVSQVANSAEAIKNAAQPLASLASSVGSLVSAVASGIKSKASSKNGDTSVNSGNNNSNQAKNKQNSDSSSSTKTKKKKKKKEAAASGSGSSTSSSGTQQQSTKKKKKKKS